MLDTYLENEYSRAREARRPVYRFSLDRYECPFCGERSSSHWIDEIREHMKTCPKANKE
jgi:hypothetical protein